MIISSKLVLAALASVTALGGGAYSLSSSSDTSLEKNYEVTPRPALELVLRERSKLSLAACNQQGETVIVWNDERNPTVFPDKRCIVG